MFFKYSQEFTSTPNYSHVFIHIAKYSKVFTSIPKYSHILIISLYSHTYARALTPTHKYYIIFIINFLFSICWVTCNKYLVFSFMKIEMHLTHVDLRVFPFTFPPLITFSPNTCRNLKYQWFLDRIVHAAYGQLYETNLAFT